MKLPTNKEEQLDWINVVIIALGITMLIILIRIRGYLYAGV